MITINVPKKLQAPDTPQDFDLASNLRTAEFLEVDDGWYMGVI